jgi:hypothetical protein
MKQTQAQQLYTALRRKPHTYMEMLRLGISTSPWRRLTEAQSKLRPGEKIVKGVNARGLVTYRVLRCS